MFVIFYCNNNGQIKLQLQLQLLIVYVMRQHMSEVLYSRTSEGGEDFVSHILMWTLI